MTLDLYIARRFIWTFLRVFSAFFAVLLGIGLIEEMRRFGGVGVTFGGGLELALLNAPAAIYQILPLIMILTAIALFLGLARSSELVVVRGSGRSGLRFLAAPVLTTLAIGLVAVTVWNPLAAATSRAYDTRVSAFMRGGSAVSVSASGLWLRQGSGSGQTVIQAQRSNLDGTELSDVTFLIYDAQARLTGRIGAAQARLTPGAWALEGAKIWALEDANPERSAGLPDGTTRLATDLTAQKIADGFASPKTVSIWDLPAYASDLERAGFSALPHRMWLMQEIAAPGFLIAMVLIAAGFTMRHTRAGGTGLRVLLAVLCGFAVFFLRNFGQILGDNGQIPIALAAAAPPLVAILLSAGLVLHLEDG